MDYVLLVSLKHCATGIKTGAGGAGGTAIIGVTRLWTWDVGLWTIPGPDGSGDVSPQGTLQPQSSASNKMDKRAVIICKHCTSS